MIATSAMLKMPVRNDPMPMFMKSITVPIATRSTQLDTPPAKNSISPTVANLDDLIKALQDAEFEPDDPVVHEP